MTDDSSNNGSDNGEGGSSDWLRADAERSPRVQAISARLRGLHLTDSIVAGGTKYTIRTLEPGEEVLAGGFVTDASAIAAGQSVPAATLAVALVAIDDSPVEVEFQLPKKLDPVIRQAIVAQEGGLKAWRYQQIHKWLAKDSLDEVLQILWKKYVEMKLLRRRAAEGLPDLSAGTRTGM